MHSQIKTTVSRELLNSVEDSQMKVQAVKNDDIQEANGLLRTPTGNEYRQEKTTISRKLMGSGGLSQEMSTDRKRRR